VFRVDPAGRETVLHTFAGGTDGAGPSTLVLDRAGNLYGIAGGGDLSCGGGVGCGIVFELDATGRKKNLHIFADTPDGAGPNGALVLDGAGNLYGTTGGGGASGFGTVFKLDPTGVEEVLYSFKGAPDGEYPRGGVVRDSAGNLYGTTYLGGASSEFGGFGTVFKLDPTGVETVLYSFKGSPDGAWPTAGLALDKAGNLYGTTSSGGSSLTLGTVFKVDPAGEETVIYSFQSCPDGANPNAGVVLDSAGNLYGATVYGGDVNCGNESGCGMVFKVDPTRRETILHTFKTDYSENAPTFPYGGLILDPRGHLYGTTYYGGSKAPWYAGTVYELTH
jgi:uncharacterized repeat protein (TIGR03803 family)